MDTIPLSLIDDQPFVLKTAAHTGVYMRAYASSESLTGYVQPDDVILVVDLRDGELIERKEDTPVVPCKDHKLEVFYDR